MKKNILKAFAAAVIAIVAVACDTDVEKATYTPSDNSGVSFRASVFYNTEIETGDVVEIEIDRAVADGALTVPISYIETSGSGVTAPSSVTFADGEYSTTIVMDVSAMVPGTSYKGTLAITDASLYDENISISSISVTLQMVYTWSLLGTGEWFDYFFNYSGSDDLDIIDVQVYKAEGFNHYRVYDPWPASKVSASWGTDLSGSGAAYFDFDIDDDGYVTFDDPLSTGWTYDYYGAEITLLMPSSWSSSYAAYDAYCCTLEGGDIVRFYWYHYMSGVGGWRGYYSVLALPSYSGNFLSWVNANY